MSRLLIQGGMLLTMEPGSLPHPADLLIEDGGIAAVGEGLDDKNAEVLPAEGRLVMPGLVQAHVHLTQTLFRGLANDRPLIDWLYERVLPLEWAHDAASVYDSARLGLAELLCSGTTTVADVGTARDIDSIFRALAESGIRAQSGFLMMDHPDTYPTLRLSTDRALDEALRVFERWDGHGGLIHCALVPRGLLSVTRNLMREAGRLADEMGAFIHCHANENRQEIARIAARCGEPPIACMETLGIAGPRLQLAHCIWLTGQEMGILRERQVKVVHCPSSNAKLASGVAPVPEMVEAGVDVALGADGAPCNDNLDAFVEMRLAGLLQKLRREDTAALPARRILEMATLGGARALGMEDENGSLKVGKRADVILVDLDAPHANPWEPETLVDLLIYAFRGSDVESVLVDGRPIVREGELLTMPLDEVLQSARQSRKRVLKKLDWV